MVLGTLVQYILFCIHSSPDLEWLQWVLIDVSPGIVNDTDRGLALLAGSTDTIECKLSIPDVKHTRVGNYYGTVCN